MVDGSYWQCNDLRRFKDSELPDGFLIDKAGNIAMHVTHYKKKEDEEEIEIKLRDESDRKEWGGKVFYFPRSQILRISYNIIKKEDYKKGK